MKSASGPDAHPHIVELPTTSTHSQGLVLPPAVNASAQRGHERKNPFVVADCHAELDRMTAESIDLIFTSPPYYNARPEYQVYESYDAYLSDMQAVIEKGWRVLKEGRFFVVNVSPVIVARRKRSESSIRLNLPADIHRLFDRKRFEFIDDITWEKPEGAGCRRGRGFAMGRKPLQYKTIPVTESVLVYRKASLKLVDWFIRTNPRADESKIAGDYERTDVWRINPARHKAHPAVFPLQLAVDRLMTGRKPFHRGLVEASTVAVTPIWLDRSPLARPRATPHPYAMQCMPPTCPSTRQKPSPPNA
jgi:hypothetical protein